MKSGLALGCGLLFFMAGCDLGEPTAHRTVTLDFPASNERTNASISAKDPEVQEALSIIDNVLVSAGFPRDGKPPGPEDQDQGIIVTYGRYAVSLRHRELTVSFFESGKRHSSPIVVRTSSSLKDKLSDRFGAQRVRIRSDS